MLASRLLLTRNTAIRRASRALLQQRSFGRSAVVADDDLPYHIVVGMPALSPTMETGILAEWYIGEGATFGAGQAIAKIETDKASIDFEAQDDGVIAKILVDAGSGEDIPVGTPIMVTVEEEEDVDAFKDFEVPAEEPTEAPAAAPVAAIEETPPPPPPAPVAAVTPRRKLQDQSLTTYCLLLHRGSHSRVRHRRLPDARKRPTANHQHSSKDHLAGGRTVKVLIETNQLPY